MEGHNAQGTSEERITSVFFLDISTGWLLFSIYEEPEPRFDLARTRDAGQTWSLARVSIPDLNPEATTLAADGGGLDFVDSLHGWMNLSIVSSSNFNLGGLFMTKDGGGTWNWAPASPGVAGIIRFVNLKDGWLAGGPGDEELYATHNGSKTWQKVLPKNPPGTGSATVPLYGAPVFRDNKKGFLPVTYIGGQGAGLFLVLFVTSDGGRSWILDRLLRLPDIGQTSAPCAIVDSLLLVATASDHILKFQNVASGTGMTPGGSPAKESALLRASSVQEISFANAMQGWVLTEAQLLATSDGGVTWNDISPIQVRP